MLTVLTHIKAQWINLRFSCLHVYRGLTTQEWVTNIYAEWHIFLNHRRDFNNLERTTSTMPFKVTQLQIPHGPLSPIVRLVQEHQSVHEHAISLNNKHLLHITLQHNNKVSAKQLHLLLSVP